MTFHRKPTLDDVFTGAFCGILLAAFLLVMGYFVLLRLGLAGNYVLPAYDAAKFYPFETESTMPVPAKKSAFSRGDSVVQRLSALIKAVEEKITNHCTSEGIPGGMYAVRVKKTADCLMGLDMTQSMGSVPVGDAVGYFAEDWLGRPLPEQDPAEHIQSVIALARDMEAQGRNFMVFENPGKYCDVGGYKNYYAENRATVNAGLRKAGISVLDLDEYIAEQGIDYKSLFFKTDHHWTPRSALWANAVLCGWLNENFGMSLDMGIFDLKNYDIQLFPKRFLGSLGKKVTLMYAEPDDFELITPAYPTDITVFSSATLETRTGAVQDTLYDLHHLTAKNIYKRNEYALYSYGDCALIDSHNNLLHDGSNMLLIHFSFADAQIPTLTQCVENLYAIDLRHFSGSLQTFIREKNPQTVILMYPITCFGEEATIYPSRRTSTFDFR